MAGFNRSYRQQIVDEYLNDSGNNHFVPAEFLDWLEDKPDHRVYSVFFGMDDEKAAREHRLLLARQFVNGLRIKVTVTPAMASSSPHIVMNVREPTAFSVPSFISPVADRRGGGGYMQTDITDAAPMRELYRQAAQALTAWLERYGDAARLAGVDVGAVEKALGSLSVAGVNEAAA